jgi:hypothetical protein
MLLKDVITLSLASVMALALVLDFALAIITTIALIFLLVPAHDTHSGVVVTKSTNLDTEAPRLWAVWSSNCEGKSCTRRQRPACVAPNNADAF